MTNRREVSSQKATVVGCALLLLASCSSTQSSGGSTGGSGGQSSTSGSASGGSSVASSSQAGGSSVASSSQAAGASSSSQAAGQSAGAGGGGKASGGQTTGTGGQGGKSTGASSGGNGGSNSGGQLAGATGGGGGTAAAGTTGSATGGKSGGASGQAGSTGSGGQSGGTKPDGGLVSGCVGNPIPTADPTKAGPFKVFAEKGVGPKAGALPDPIYGNEQQRFNIYRPENIETSGYCHPILVWANGYTDNPEPNGPCILDGKNGKWCGQYLPIISHLASHGFVVIASLSTTTASGNPLPTIVGLDWLLDPKSVTYYDHLDTANIGQLGHSMGGMSTCMSASEPRYKALMSICGTRELKGLHTPFLFFCGGKDDRVSCDSVRNVFQSVKDQPAFFMNETNSDHGSWVYGGTGSPSLSGAAAWFRIHLMNDTANRKYFYGADCTFCKDSRVKVEKNGLMTE